MNDTVRSLGAITEGRQTQFVPPTAPAMPPPPLNPPPTAWQAPNQPHATRYAQAPQQQAPMPASAVKPASTTPAWLIPAAAVLVAIVFGVLVAEIFFV
jgi:hypothetical protein